jgi:hypothetical protein
VLRRLDEDEDGHVSAPEFKQALKRLRVRDANKWSVDMSRMLFARVNAKKENSVSVSELISFVRQGQGSTGLQQGQGQGSRVGNSTGSVSKSNLSDDEDDAGIFAKNYALSDNLLVKKVCWTDAKFY